MHIPDGYLSPSTCAVLYAASAPFYYVATKRVRSLVANRMAPLLSVFAAFSFVIMMFNIPLPGGTSGHAVGATLAAVVLGPWGAMLAVGVALTLQAIFFGDGGILALGANLFNMAIVMPLVASFAYRALRGSQPTPRSQIVASAIAGYLALNVAAFLTAVEFGIQPIFFTAADGAPLYAPYGLDVAVPAMMLGHIVLAGPVEALVTALAVSYILRTNPSLLQVIPAPTIAQATHRSPRLRPLWVGIALLVVLAPIGLLTKATAWGEWSPSNPADWPLPFVPQGLQSLSELWRAPLPDYVVPFLGEGQISSVLGYSLSALVGVLLIVIVGYVIGRLVARGQDTDVPTPDSPLPPTKGR